MDLGLLGIHPALGPKVDLLDVWDWPEAVCATVFFLYGSDQMEKWEIHRDDCSTRAESPSIMQNC
jgi:hypothetical protein